MTRLVRRSLFACMTLGLGCSGDERSATSQQAATVCADCGGSAQPEAGLGSDAGPPEVGFGSDAGPPDVGVGSDAALPDAGVGSDAGPGDAEPDAGPGDAAICSGALVDCYNILQVFEETDAAHRPIPGCMQVASWMASAAFDPAAVDLGGAGLESANLPTDATPQAIHDALYDGSLVSFNMMSADGSTLCTFVSTWNEPLKSSWIVDAPALTPISDAPAEDVCDNGWGDAMDACRAEENALLDAADANLPPPDPDDTDPPDPDYVIDVDPS